MASILRLLILASLLRLICDWSTAHAATFRIATYNLENYVDASNEVRRAKSPEGKAKVRESIVALAPDVIAIQEVGSESALEELRAALEKDRLEFRYQEFVRGFDPNIHVAVLSRYPILARRSHTHDSFLLRGRRFRVSRGFAEVDVKVSEDYTFTLIAAHLKSRRAAAEADEAEMRLEEAKLLREKIDARLAANAEANLILLGDFNDTKDSAALRVLIGRGKSRLVDTRPAERNGDQGMSRILNLQPRTIAWTHHYGKEDTYSRIDYILLSPGMAREWKPEETYVLAIPNWGVGSDHRPLVAGFESRDRGKAMSRRIESMNGEAPEGQ